MARTQQQFSTIRTEGALLPPDVLQQIAAGKADGLRPADYHLPEGYKLNEAITQAWDLLRKHWKSFQEARARLSESDTGTEVTNKHWLLPLFRELDYGHLPTQPAPVIDERSYPIERLYNHIPIHLVGCNLLLDRRTKGARGAATASPHSMVQEFLNRSEGHLWAIVTNGLRLRLLRDNVALSRQAFVEFDLEAMMEGEVFADFALLWLLLHQSRVESPKADDCWLESWSKLARESGTRILKQLRESVRRSIEALGQGFISHPRNEALREKLRSGELSRDDYYRQILRIVYRFLFLFVAEDRELLHPPAATEQARDRYQRFYSLSRLRDMALKLRGSKHGDLWHALSLVFAGLGDPDGCPTLGLVGFGSFLWTPDKTPDLNGPHEASDGRVPVAIANDDLLLAIHSLAYVQQDGVLRSVDYRNLGSEELGSVYESLLELHPDIEIDAQRFTLASAAGNQRKTSGSYYTPDSLVQCLLDSALDPVVKDRLEGKKGKDAEPALLALTVCDPACGSGHFLIAAAHRLARHLARIRTGESEPAPEDHQTALRDVISRCIYGVDLNPMAVELCKVSLWMEAIDPGKPLSFLDHHIKCGNSLLGVTPRLLNEGIPEAAYTAIEGDDKAVVKELKARHKKEVKDRTGGRQTYLFEPYLKLGRLADAFLNITTGSNDTVADIARKASLYAELIAGAEYRNASLLADTWCSAFVWKKDASDLGLACPTERDYRDCETNPHSLIPHVRHEIARLAGEFSFFHWHLAFPEVFRVPAEGREPESEQMGWDGGFDVLLGNPPWEKVNLNAREWFATSRPDIANAGTSATRTRLINTLRTEDDSLYAAYKNAQRVANGVGQFLKASNNYPLSSRGDTNTYAVFADLDSRLANGNGRAGFIVPSGIAFDETTKLFFQHLVDKGFLLQLLDFDNGNAIFPGVHRSYRFCLITAVAMPRSTTATIAMQFFIKSSADLGDPTKSIEMSPADIALINPNTRTCPIFRSRSDAEITKRVYQRLPILMRESGGEDTNPWAIELYRMLHSSADSIYYRSGSCEEPLRVYEAKCFHQNNHRFAQYLDSYTRSNLPMLSDPCSLAATAHYVSSCELPALLQSKIRPWYLAYRCIGRSTDERTMISSILPRCAVINSANIFDGLSGVGASTVLAALNSFVVDYLARQSVGGANIQKFVVQQLPFITPQQADSPPGWTSEQVKRWILHRITELTFTAVDLEAFARDCGYEGLPFRRLCERRSRLGCELDAAYFHLYLGSAADWVGSSPRLCELFPSPRNAVEHVMETFPIAKRKDVAKYGSYRTKERILAIYDEMAECIANGTEWKSPLDPPPGDPRAAWTEEEMEMWRQGRGDELIEKYGLLDDADASSDADDVDADEAEAGEDA